MVATGARFFEELHFIITGGHNDDLCEGAQREYGPRELLLRQVRQEVCLVLDGVWRQREPDLAGWVLWWGPHQPGVVARGNPVKAPAEVRFQVLVEGAELHPAQECRRWSEPSQDSTPSVSASCTSVPHKLCFSLHRHESLKSKGR